MKIYPIIFAAALLISIAPSAIAASAPVSQVKVTGAYVQSAPESSANTAAFLSIENPSSQDQLLVRVESKAAKAVEIHGHMENHGMMKMEKADSVKIPAKGSVTLQPGGFHIMLIGLTAEARKAKSIELILRFKDGSSVNVQAPYRSADSDSHHHR